MAIRFLADNIDQLDLAVDQLAVNDRNFDRFAIMLIDNVVELTLHRFVVDRDAENRLWLKLKEPKYDQALLKEALGQRFDAKVKCATALSLLSAASCEAILSLHQFRNTAYHQGLRHEAILHDLGVLYFEIAIELLIAYKPRAWAWSSADTYPHRARKYLGEPTGLDPEQRFAGAYSRLLAVVEPMRGHLVEALHSDLEATIDNFDSALDFIEENSPRPLTRAGIIAEAQAWFVVLDEQVLAFAGKKGYRPPNALLFVEWLIENYKFPVRGDPVPSWRSRCDALNREKSEKAALKKYCAFMGSTSTIRQSVLEWATQLEDSIQDEIDRRRGK